MIHFYCLAVEAGFYSDAVECLPVNPASWVRFPAGAGKIFSLYDIYFWYLLVLYFNCSVKRLNFAPKWSISYFQPILVAIFVTIATVKVI